MEPSTISILGYFLVLPSEAKQLLLAAVVGLLIGLDRAMRGKVASLRTFSMIATGSCLYAILSVDPAISGDSHFDRTRIAAQIVSGVGFLGGGVIFKTADRVEGITTAAMIWLTAALGMACGFNQVHIVYWAFAVGVLVHFASALLHRLIDAFVLHHPNGSRRQASE